MRLDLKIGMQGTRTVLFWMHLVLGLVVGVVILLMSVTGVALTYEKQVLEWADLQSGAAPAGGDRPPLAPEALVTAATSQLPGGTPTGLVLRADGRMPVTVTFEGGRALLVEPATGRALGEPSPRLRQFFRLMTNWHRWLALEGASRATGRAVTGAANLGFLFLVLSGLYLWLPKAFTWVQVRQVLWFRRGLAPKARDFNWHHVIGFWSALPLALVVAGAVPISYSWAGALVYRLAGDTPPQPAAGGPAATARTTGAPVSAEGLDAALAAAQAAVPGWRTATLRLADAGAPLTAVVDTGYGGQPQYRTTLTIDRATGQVTKRETFADLGPGRQWRSWFRFVHTGEYYGLAGQTLAGLVSAGGAVLVYTGVALSLRRAGAWRRRRQAPTIHRSAAA